MICHIVGYPLKNPRSVKIWNNFFKLKKISARMTKKEISSSQLPNFIKYIKNHNKFHAMAVTMPYKKNFYKECKIIDDDTKYSKSVNLVIKKNNKLFGYNTDIISLVRLFRVFKKRNILIIGMGGVGSSILNVFKKKYTKSNITVITSKKKGNLKKIFFYKKISEEIIKNKDLIINCTPLGSNLAKKFIDKTPMNENLFKYIDKKTIIYDLVYSPNKTKLFEICKRNKIKYINGLKMNTLQAKIALKIAF